MLFVTCLKDEMNFLTLDLNRCVPLYWFSQVKETASSKLQKEAISTASKVYEI
jgi:hypothetical protein